MRRKSFWILALLLAGTFLGSCCIGRFPLTLGEILEICAGTMEDGMKRDIFLKIRLSRTLFAGMAGAALAVSGLVYQELFANPLVSPDVLGVSGGACVGAVGVILLGGSALAVQTSALAFGILTVILALGLSKVMGGAGRVNLLLSGIVMKALMDAAIMTCKYLADPSGQLASIDYWLMGSLNRIGWEEVRLTAPFTGLAFGVLCLFRWQLQVLSLGEEEAKTLGVSTGITKLAGIGAATVLAAVCTAMTGVVSWVGLIVPHMVRFLLGKNLLMNFGVCGLAGAILMIWTDTAARSLTASEIPVSIVTSVLGAVFLLLVLVRKRRKGEIL